GHGLTRAAETRSGVAAIVAPRDAAIHCVAALTGDSAGCDHATDDPDYRGASDPVPRRAAALPPGAVPNRVLGFAVPAVAPDAALPTGAFDFDSGVHSGGAALRSAFAAVRECVAAPAFGLAPHYVAFATLAAAAH